VQEFLTLLDEVQSKQSSGRLFAEKDEIIKRCLPLIANLVAETCPGNQGRLIRGTLETANEAAAFFGPQGPRPSANRLHPVDLDGGH
jgi:hypothetical protein